MSAFYAFAAALGATLAQAFCRSTSREFLVDVTRRELFVLREIAGILRHGMVREDAAPTLAAPGARGARRSET